LMAIEQEKAELIQVAAVATASLENMLYGQAAFEARVGSIQLQGEEVLDLVADERASQDVKWGEQRHSRLEWAMILAEEIGEWAEEVFKGSLEEEGNAAAFYVLHELASAGLVARGWLETHRWEPRQQKVYDAESRRPNPFPMHEGAQR